MAKKQARIARDAAPALQSLSSNRVAASPPQWMLTGGLALAVIIYLLHALHFWHQINDDAYITFRYSRFLALGRGPFFNPGEHVEGYTNFLLMILVAPVISLFGENAGPLFAKGLGVLCGVFAIVVAFDLCLRLDRAVERPTWSGAISAMLAAGLIAVCPAYAINSTSGLETLLFSATISLGVYLGIRGVLEKRCLGSGIAFAAAILTRPEGALFFAIYWCTQALILPPTVWPLLGRNRLQRWRDSKLRRHLVPDAIIVIAIFLAHLGFRLMMYDGEFLPNTYYAKAGGFWGKSLDYVRGGATGPFFGLIGTSIGLLGWLIAKNRRLVSLPVAIVAICGSLLPFVTGTDWMTGWRLIAPFLPLLAVTIAIGWTRLAELAAFRWPPAAVIFVLATVPAAWFFQDRPRSGFYSNSMLRARGYQTGHEALARWLKTAAKKGETIAIMDTGIVGYRCIDQKILDITGLTDRYIAKSPGLFLDKKYDINYVLNKKPEFVVIVVRRNGDPEKPLPPDAKLATWTPIEQAITDDEEFRKHYLATSPPADAPNDWTTALGLHYGAERVFEHKHPGMYYLLAVFRRHD